MSPQERVTVNFRLDVTIVMVDRLLYDGKNCFEKLTIEYSQRLPSLP